MIRYIFPMEIDIVYTWVNSQDSAWQKKRAEFAKEETGEDLSYRAGECRFRDNDELKYSLRSIEKYLPFIRRVYIVHTGAAPDWLRKDRDDLVFVSQEDILPKSCFPSYQSDVIESFLYKIPGLSEYYIYSNDDTFFCAPHTEGDLFNEEGKARVGITPRLAGDYVTSVCRAMELNAGRALKKRIRTSKPVVVSRYPWFPVAARCLVKGIMPFNTMTHVAQPFRKSIWPEFHKIFADEIGILCQSRFRSPRGFTINMMAHHFALSSNKAIFELHNENDYMGRSAPVENRDAFKRGLLEKSSEIKRFCLNDEPADNNDGWNDYVAGILNNFFPKASRWEFAA
jgi:hypothetical protein